MSQVIFAWGAAAFLGLCLIWVWLAPVWAAWKNSREKGDGEFARQGEELRSVWRVQRDNLIEIRRLLAALQSDLRKEATEFDASWKLAAKEVAAELAEIRSLAERAAEERRRVPLDIQTQIIDPVAKKLGTEADRLGGVFEKGWDEDIRRPLAEIRTALSVRSDQDGVSVALDKILAQLEKNDQRLADFVGATRRITRALEGNNGTDEETLLFEEAKDIMARAESKGVILTPEEAMKRARETRNYRGM
jgi:hypothetical protein